MLTTNSMPNLHLSDVSYSTEALPASVHFHSAINDSILYHTASTRNFPPHTSTANRHPDAPRSAWAGQTPFVDPPPTGAGPLAVLTRATIKPGIMARFWGRVPDISSVIGQDPNVMFKIGIGDVPWLRQVTFSIWPDTASMASFARADGPHATAIRAVRDEGLFKEELYARFSVDANEGRWAGQTPYLTAARIDHATDMKVGAE